MITPGSKVWMGVVDAWSPVGGSDVGDLGECTRRRYARLPSRLDGRFGRDHKLAGILRGWSGCLRNFQREFQRLDHQHAECADFEFDRVGDRDRTVQPSTRQSVVTYVGIRRVRWLQRAMG